MTALKVRCPGCDARLKLDAEPGAEASVDCPMWGAAFTAVVGNSGGPKDRPRYRKPASKAGPNRLLLGKAIAGIVLTAVGCAVGLVFIVGGPKEKNPPAAKAGKGPDAPPRQQQPQPQPKPQPEPTSVWRRERK